MVKTTELLDFGIGTIVTGLYQSQIGDKLSDVLTMEINTQVRDAVP